MAFYRAQTTLSGKRDGEFVKTGEITRLEWVKPQNVQILVARGKVFRLETPPLEVLAGWQTRGAKLAKAGIVTIDDFLESDNEQIRKALKVSVTTVRRYRAELELWGTQNEKAPHERH